MSLEPATPLQNTMARAKAWLPAQLQALFKERKTDAIAFLAAIAETRDVVGSAKAYDLLHPLLFWLVDHPKVDVAPLVPLLQRICAFETYDPDKKFRYEAVRLLSLRLDLGAPKLRALLDTMLLDYDRPQRRAALADAEASLKKLERTKR